MRGNRNVGLLIVFLLITVAMAVAFFPSVNQNVAAGLNAIAPLAAESLGSATITVPSTSWSCCWWASAS